MATTATMEDTLLPEDLTIWRSTKVPFQSDPTCQMRVWHARQLTSRGKVTDEHVTSVFGLVFATAVQKQGKKDEIENESKMLREWALSRLRNIFIALAHRYKVLLEGQPVASWYAQKCGQYSRHVHDQLFSSLHIGN
eukprot:scaffold168299_cov33-Attheya_sp.AAC.2